MRGNDHSNHIDLTVEEQRLHHEKSSTSLGEIKDSVIKEIMNMPELSRFHVDGLHRIPVGKLRSNAVRLHAVCRYRKGVRKTDKILPLDVKCIDIHPKVLNHRWIKYAKFLLYHEYLHALGFSNHGKKFRRLEALWYDQDAKKMGRSFGVYVRKLNDRWLWLCPSCGIRYSRSKKSNGRYRCRSCNSLLIDIQK